MAMQSRLMRLSANLNRFSDLTLALLLVAIIGLLIVPLPTWLVDGLIAVNLMISVVMLMLSLYLPRALAFSTFPSMLLFTTLFRLALNVTTTRLILLHADAGAIIHTFGSFVVGGNFAVGAVIFLIITVVQFVVISKGAERVSEVAARFTLDAMPGKQMSIDADMRAGAINLEQARARRAELTAESQLYGAMDGAMKFVKGDAIAGLVITAINLIGGFCIGLFMNGWEMGKAMRVFSILTIGDGLVSQIPALLVAITSGIIVTRVGNESGNPLGHEIATQFSAQPKAILLGALVVAAIGCIPGFPKIPLFGLATLVAALGYGLLVAQRQRSDASSAEAASPSPTTSTERFTMVTPLFVELDSALRPRLGATLPQEVLTPVRQALYQSVGVPLPDLQVLWRPNLISGLYRLFINEVPVAEGRLFPEKQMVFAREETLRSAGVAFVEGVPWGPHQRAFWVDPDAVAELERSGLQCLTPQQALTNHLTQSLQRYAGDFLSLQETRQLLDTLDREAPELVREVQRLVPLQKLTEVLQRLVQEQISIRNLKQITQALIEWGQKEKDPVLLVEYVRSALSRTISYRFAGNQHLLAAYVLEPELEEQLRQAIRQTASGSYLALDAETVRRLLRQLHQTMGDLSQVAQKPVVVVPVDIRRYFRKLIDKEFYDVPVLSYQELSPDIQIQPLGRLLAVA